MGWIDYLVMGKGSALIQSSYLAINHNLVLNSIC